MPADNNVILQAEVTRTTTLNGNTVDLKTGTPRRGLKARIIYSAANTSAGAGAATFKIQESDNDSTWRDLVTFDPLVLGTAAIEGLLFEGFETSARYVRLALSAISGTDATITYQGDILPARP